MRFEDLTRELFWKRLTHLNALRGTAPGAAAVVTVSILLSSGTEASGSGLQKALRTSQSGRIGAVSIAASVVESVTYVTEATMDTYIGPLFERLNSSAFFTEAEAKKRRKKKKNKSKNGTGGNPPGDSNFPAFSNPPEISNPPTPTPEPTPEPPVLRERRSIFSLSVGEVQSLTSAFNAMKNAGNYDDFVSRHFDAMSVAHRGALFLPWHRKFLEELESGLLAVNPSIRALPYWPWEQGSGSLWTDAYFGPDGDRGNGSRVLTGPFANWRALIYNAITDRLEHRGTVGLVRRLGSSGDLPTQAQIQAALNTSAYDNIRPALENSPIHDAVHNWVGGDMTSGTSPNDPIFFLHHCTVDRLWWQWQQANGIANYQGPTDPMPFLQGSTTPAQVFDIHGRGYTYQ